MISPWVFEFFHELTVVLFGVTDHDGIERHHQLFSEHVIPALRKA